MSTLKVNAIEPANVGSEDYFLSRAWASVNQVTTTTILNSGNVSSVTDNATGRFTLNLTNTLADANFCWNGNGKRADTSNIVLISQQSVDAKTTNSIGVSCHQGSWTLVDFPDVCVNVTR